jgi:hypothetical protein
MNAAATIRRWSHPLSIGLLAAAGLALDGRAADARIVKIEITSRETPTFDGRTFGEAGAYEKLRGKAYGEVDPADPRNAAIADIQLAPRNASGKVVYAMDIFILKPIDSARGNQRLFVDINNRGTMRWETLNSGFNVNNPSRAADAGTGFLMQQGYTIVGNGWDVQVKPVNDRLTITVPVAKNADGSPVTGRSYEYINFDTDTGATYSLAYPAATLDTSKATLTSRAQLDAAPVAVPDGAWHYVDERTIGLLPAGTVFKKSYIYELTYTAKDPVVSGLGLAATRDFIAFLRHATADDSGTMNPVRGQVRYAYSYAVSQSARYINDLQTFGFNEDEQGQRVLDGVLNWIGGGSGANVNYRFAQPGRTERNRQDHLYPEGVFPFAYPMLTDHLSGRTAGRSQRCAASGTCPYAFEVNSANEYWVKAASLLHTDTKGHDLQDPANVRFYLLSGLQHGISSERAGMCQQPLNGTRGEPALRALLVALDAWVSGGVTPPDSAVPRRGDNTAVLAVPRPGFQTGMIPKEALGWPAIPGVNYTGAITTRYLLDFGPKFLHGILTNYPPSVDSRPAYVHFVSKVDDDGNELAGIRLPAVGAPIATTTGWALRRAGFGASDGCEGAGQSIAFKPTQAERMAAGDPRRSLDERYGSHDGYVRAVDKAAHALEQRRLLLPADVRQYIEQAEASAVLK